MERYETFKKIWAETLPEEEGLTMRQWEKLLKDLYFRLNGVPVCNPNSRLKIEKALMVIRHFISDRSARYKIFRILNSE